MEEGGGEYLFCSISIGRIGKISSTKSVYLFYSNVSKFSPNRPIDHRDTILWRKMCSILYDAYLFRNYSKYQNKLVSKIVSFLDFTSVYTILFNFINWMKRCKCLIYSLPFRPLFIAPASVRV